MERHRLVMTAVAMMVAMAASAHAQTSVGVSANVGNAPPPPLMVVREEPRVVVVPGSTVYVVNDSRVGYDFFRYGTYWYIYRGGYWYRARGYRGPFAAIHVRYVPAAIIRVPAKHWKHHPHGGPPGLVKKERGHRPDVVVVKAGGGKKGKDKR